MFHDEPTPMGMFQTIVAVCAILITICVVAFAAIAIDDKIRCPDPCDCLVPAAVP